MYRHIYRHFDGMWLNAIEQHRTYYKGKSPEKQGLKDIIEQ